MLNVIIVTARASCWSLLPIIALCIQPIFQQVVTIMLFERPVSRFVISNNNCYCFRLSISSLWVVLQWQVSGWPTCPGTSSTPSSPWVSPWPSLLLLTWSPILALLYSPSHASWYEKCHAFTYYSSVYFVCKLALHMEWNRKLGREGKGFMSYIITNHSKSGVHAFGYVSATKEKQTFCK